MSLLVVCLHRATLSNISTISPVHMTAGSEISPVHMTAGSEISPVHMTAGSEISPVLTVCGKKTLPCTVRFTPDRLSQTEVKRILNGPQTGAERTVHGPFRFMYVAHTYMRIN